MTANFKALPLVFSLILQLASCSTAPPRPGLFRSALRHDLLGCYALYSSKGRPLDSSFYRASPRVRLDSVPAWPTYRDSRRVVPRLMLRLDATERRIDSANSPHSLGPSWVVDSMTDTLRLSFSDGFSGAALSLSASAAGDTLRGHIKEAWDFGPPFETSRGKGWAVRVPCMHSEVPS